MADNPKIDGYTAEETKMYYLDPMHWLNDGITKEKLRGELLDACNIIISLLEQKETLRAELAAEATKSNN